MTWPAPFRRRPAFVRCALAVGLVAFAACVGHDTGCDDRLPGLAMLPAMALQMSSIAVSFGSAVVAWVRRDDGKALAEVLVGLLMVLAIVVAEAVYESVPSRSCE